MSGTAYRQPGLALVEFLDRAAEGDPSSPTLEVDERWHEFLSWPGYHDWCAERYGLVVEHVVPDEPAEAGIPQRAQCIKRLARCSAELAAQPVVP